MMNPFDLTPIIARLVAEVSELQEVGAAADYAAIESLSSFRTPSAYVVLAGEKDISPDIDNPQRRPSGAQQVESLFGVVVAVQNFRDSVGSAATADASPIIAAVRGALMGWSVDIKKHRPIRWMQGDVMDYDASTLLWIDVFSVRHFLTR